MLDAITQFIAQLPPAHTIANVAQRQALIDQPTRTFSALWSVYVQCALSSQKDSKINSALDIFCRSDSPLLQLDAVVTHGSDSAWVEQLLRSHKLGSRVGYAKLTQMLTHARQAFMAARPASDALAEGVLGASGLDNFIRMANGQWNDRDVSAAAAASAELDASRLTQIGHKQLRNIALNTGLAVNVLPLDSRWNSVLARMLPAESINYSDKTKYLALEDFIRQGLIAAQRSDIPNLSILDALVFRFLETHPAALLEKA